MQYFTSFDGLKLAYSDQGSGQPLLCLAGLTRNSSDFDYLAPHLPPVRLIRLDYRGRGASDWSDDPSTYSWDIEARDAIDLLDHLNIDKTAILGTSRGGMIAMYLAATAKDRLSGICLNDIGPEFDQSGLDQIKTYVGQPPPYATRQEMADALPARSPDFQNVGASRWREEADRRSIETVDGLALTYDPRLRLNLDKTAGSPTPDLWPLFDTMNGLPLALIRGANSNILSAATAAEMRRRRPDMIFAEIADRGHIPFLDEPPAIAAITDWLETCQ
ncbi:MAG: alpha/beta fold hydrolase [Paracoccaceae bacterium]